MLGRLEMDIDECISSYVELMTTVFARRKSINPLKWNGKIKGRFSSKKLKSAIDHVITKHDLSPQAMLDDGVARGCKV